MIPHTMPVFWPDDILHSLFHNYPDEAQKIFKVDECESFWDQIKDDDPKLLTLIKELKWATKLRVLH